MTRNVTGRYPDRATAAAPGAVATLVLALAGFAATALLLWLPAGTAIA